MCVCAYVCVHMCVCICVCAYVCVHMCVCICVCAYVCVHMCVCICVCACMCVHACICVHKHIHMYKYFILFILTLVGKVGLELIVKWFSPSRLTPTPGPRGIPSLYLTATTQLQKTHQHNHYIHTMKFRMERWNTVSKERRKFDIFNTSDAGFY